ncbi:hypothetical protein BRD00_07320 [Halobacteriales archaeon QS_8_69_26]|nr:MAG: hypothetical protein BRD00_07320 [Halobacteriales archaeon QS_8_69_26]
MQLPDPPWGRVVRVRGTERNRTEDRVTDPSDGSRDISEESPDCSDRTLLTDGSGDPDGDDDAGGDPGAGPDDGLGEGAEDEPETVTKDVSEFGPEEFRREAEEFAAAHGDKGFDFTVASLEALDDYALEQAGILGVLGEEADDRLFDEATAGFVLRFGSYFGEVLVREFDAEWGRDGEDVHVAVPAGEYTVELSPLEAALTALREAPRFADLAADLQDTVEDAEAGDLSLGGPASLHEEVRGEAEDLVEFWTEYDLDYSPDSLPELEILVDAAWENDRYEDAEYGGDREQDVAFTRVVRQVGSYFGEVLVRSLDADWVQDETTVVEVRGPDGATNVDVFGVAEDSLTGPSRFVEPYDAAREDVGIED